MNSLLKGLPSAGTRARTEVISEGLCDDIIQLLAPSLGPFVGGTILDYLPGAGVFSRKLHDFLKPRRHILVEPEWDVYSACLDPLVQDPDTKYIRSPARSHSKLHPLFLQWYIDDGIMPAEPEDNNATLQIVNATSPMLKTLPHQQAPIDTLSYFFPQHVLQKKHFHSRGPVRLLAWCQDKHKYTCVPRSVDHRRKTSAILEHCVRVEEVVGFGSVGTDTRRQRTLNAESDRRVQERMKESHLVIPPHRQLNEDLGDALVPRYWHPELYDLEAAYAAGEFSKYTDGTGGATKRNKPRTERFTRMSTLRNRLNSQNGLLTDLQPLLDGQRNIDALYLQTFTSPTIHEEEKAKVYADIERRQNTIFDTVARITSQNRRAIFYFLADEYKAFNLPSGPLLPWDNRSYEPLSASTSEFLPHRKLALLDFQENVQPDMPLTPEQFDYYSVIARGLLGPQGHHSLRLLDKCALAACDALVPKVAEFTDPREGGRLDPMWLPNRAITPKQLWRLALEWDKWLFKPDLDELYMAPPTISGMRKQRFTRAQAAMSG